MRPTAKARFLSLLMLLTTTAAVQSAQPDEEALLADARSAVAGFAAALKSELTTTMQAGGPVEAIQVCHSEAPAIAASLSQQEEMNLARVSMRNRNPDNAPNPWQKAVLESFDSLLADGADPGTLEWHEIAASDGGHEFRYMKAIPTAGLCLACHGTTLAGPVAAKLAELYPDDKATGFSEGDLRGAFVVTRALE